MKWLKYALQNIARNKRRSMMTIMISCVGTVAILVSTGFVLYTYNSLKEMSARDSGHVIVAHADYFDKDEEFALEFGLAGYQNIAEQWLPHSEVKNVLPKIKFSGMMSTGDKSTIFMGEGIQAAELQVKGPFMSLLEGKVLSFEDSIDPQVMLGKDLAKSMKASIGSYVTLLATTSEGALNCGCRAWIINR